MIRLVRALALTSLFLSLPISASALGISVAGYSSSTGSTTLFAGDTITINLVVENNTNEDISGLELIATGYDDDRNGIADSGLEYSSGQVAPGLFNTINLPGVPNQAFGGLSNIRTSPVEQWLFDNFDKQELRVSFFGGAALSPSNGDGSLDIGIGGDFISNGDVHFSITFAAQALTTGPGEPTSQLFNLEFGTDAQYGAIPIAPDGSTIAGFSNATFGITVVPEPGTALLMGLGLIGLATSGRSKA